MAIISYAQNGEDVLLNRVFAGLNYGFYIDIGAHHPVDDSVTKAFYDRGWSGINVEPGEVFAELAAARTRDINLRMAVLDRSGDVTFRQYPGWYSGLSHAETGDTTGGVQPSDMPVQVTSVSCDTLENIVNTYARNQPIAFLKIDAEGAEALIIGSTDWRRIRPTVLVIEATAPRSNQLNNQEWEPILLRQGYQRAYFDGINCFYLADESADLLRHFAVPVNRLDGHQLPNPELATLREQVGVAEARLAAVSAERTHCNEQLQEHVANEVALREALVALRGFHKERVEALQAELQAAAMAQSRAENDARPEQGALGGGAEAVGPQASTSDDDMPPTHDTRRPLARRVAWWVYSVFRPIARPIAWRTRTFMTGEISARLARIDVALEQLRATQNLPEGTADLSIVRAELTQFSAVLEKTLLSLAMDRNKN